MRTSSALAGLMLYGAALATPFAAMAQDEAGLRAADARQRDAVAASDVVAIARIAHPNLRVNAPTNQILSKEDLLRMVKSGAVRNDVFERTIESVTITGDVGVVMGREIVVSGPVSDAAKMFGVKPLNRRYTNIFLFTDGKWLHLARHAHVVQP